MECAHVFKSFAFLEVTPRPAPALLHLSWLLLIAEAVRRRAVNGAVIECRQCRGHVCALLMSQRHKGLGNVSVVACTNVIWEAVQSLEPAFN